MFIQDDIDNFNNEVNEWGKRTLADAVKKLDQLGVVHSEHSKSVIPLRKALKLAIAKRYGIASRVSFKLPKHAIYLEKGVGRGTPAYKAGKTGRQSKRFLSPVIDKNLSQLADIVADNQGDMILNAIKIK